MDGSTAPSKLSGGLGDGEVLSAVVPPFTRASPTDRAAEGESTRGLEALPATEAGSSIHGWWDSATPTPPKPLTERRLTRRRTTAAPASGRTPRTTNRTPYRFMVLTRRDTPRTPGPLRRPHPQGG